MPFLPGLVTQHDTTITITVTALACTVCTMIFHRLVRTSGWQLNSDAAKFGMTMEVFSKGASCNLACMVMHSGLGPAALYAFLLAGDWHDGGRFDLSPKALGTPSGVLTSDPADLSHIRLVQHCGALFTGFSLYQNIMWLCDWDGDRYDPVSLFHHVVLFSCGLILSYNVCLLQLAVAAISMELSSPLLNVMLTFRQVKGKEWLAFAAGPAFVLVFFATRVISFGYQVSRHAKWLLVTSADDRAEAVPGTPPWQVHFVLALFFAGWLLQCYWGWSIGKKFVRHLSGKKID